MSNVYVTAKIPQNGLNLLRKNGFNVEFNDKDRDLSKNELKEVLAKYEAVITLVTDKVDEELLKNASGDLKIISNYGVGYDNIDVLAANRKRITVTNTPGVASESVAEHAFMLILACAKRLTEADRYVRLGKYKRWDPMAFISPQVWGKTLGIVGLGKIGTFVAQIASGGFRMRILYYDPHRAEDFELLTGAEFFSDIHKLLKEADIVTIHCPLTPQTKHLIGKAELKMMKKEAILINTARGPIVDEEALIWALKEGEIAAAGLDVFEHEPNISEGLLTLNNVILTPHIASATLETREAMSKIAAQNIIDVFEGRQPFGLVKVE